MWPKNERFRRIAAKIADKTLQYLRLGRKVGALNVFACHCPLGCAVDSFRPMAIVVANNGLMGLYEADAFIAGFEARLKPKDRKLSAYYRLGLAYRERFP